MVSFAVAKMIHGVLALIFAAVLGVSGLIDEVQFYGGTMVVVPDTGQRWGLALGGIVFHTEANNPVWGYKAIKHEIGHLEQERLLGPLYIPLVGIPSVLCTLTHTHGWPETWANELGGVKR